MSEQKQIKINMADFDFNTTRKRKPKEKPTAKANANIKIKSTTSKPKPDTLKKRSLLRMIRQQQEDRYNKLFGTSSTSNLSTKTPEVKEMSEMKTEIDRAKDYLNNLKDKHENAGNNHNTTVKRTYTNQPVYPPAPVGNMNHSTSQVTSHRTHTQNVISQSSVPSPKPSYGCLKNGSLPTYRNFIRTSKNQPSITIGETVTSAITNSANKPMSNMNIPSLSTEQANINTNVVDMKINDGLKRMSELNQSNEIMTKIKNKYRPKRRMQRKTVRRTYKIGRSSKLPKVSVLISNKTIRNNTTTKSQLLKQTSIQDVKRHLIKRGLIKVGSTTPNDVLRKMYESTMLICGDIQNHNPDNVLYNYMNGEEDV